MSYIFINKVNYNQAAILNYFAGTCDYRLMEAGQTNEMFLK